MTKIGDELLALADDEGIIYPATVVDWAQSHPDSALHEQFEWDERRAAHQYWLYTARKLIAVHVVNVAGERQTIALTIDYPTGGYRPMDSVLENAELRRQAVLQALRELQRWSERNERLTELTPIFRTITRVARRFEEPPAADAAA